MAIKSMLELESQTFFFITNRLGLQCKLRANDILDWCTFWNCCRKPVSLVMSTEKLSLLRAVNVHEQQVSILSLLIQDRQATAIQCNLENFARLFLHNVKFKWRLILRNINVPCRTRTPLENTSCWRC